MAIIRVGSTSNPVAVSAPSVGGVEFTQATAEISVQNVIRAKGSDGDVKAVLLSAAKATFQGSGYSSSGVPASLGTTFSAFNQNFTISESTAEQTAEDFTRVSVTGVGVA